MQGETSGNLQAAYMAIVAMVRDHLGYYAEKLHGAMRGLGTDEDALTRHIVGRCEVFKHFLIFIENVTFIFSCKPLKAVQSDYILI